MFNFDLEVSASKIGQKKERGKQFQDREGDVVVFRLRLPRRPKRINGKTIGIMIE